MSIYALLGLSIDSDLSLAPGAEVDPSAIQPRPDLVVREIHQAPSDDEGAVLLLRTQVSLPQGAFPYLLHLVGDVVSVSLDGFAELRVSRGGIQVRRGPAVTDAQLAPVVIMFGLSIWFELGGRPVLHGSAITFRSHAVVFLADSGTGKSVAASAFAAAGGTVMSDDLVVVELSEAGPIVHGAGGDLRLRADAAEHFCGDPHRLRDTGFGDDKRILPLGYGAAPGHRLDRIYVLDRATERGPIQLTRCSGAEAVVRLVRFTYGPRTVAATGLERGRLAALAGLASKVPISRLTYPSGFDHLPELIQAVSDDLS